MQISGKNFVAFDCNKYEPIFKCDCGYDEIFWSYKFCPICGQPLEIDEEMRFNKEQSAMIPNDYFEEHEVR